MVGAQLTRAIARKTPAQQITTEGFMLAKYLSWNSEGVIGLTDRNSISVEVDENANAWHDEEPFQRQTPKYILGLECRGTAHLRIAKRSYTIQR